MTGETFQERLNLLGTFQFVEDFEASLCDLYLSCEQDQRIELRRLLRSKIIRWPRQWRDRFGENQSPAQRWDSLRQSFIMRSALGGRDDYRDDLLTIAATYNELRLLGADADTFLRSIAALSDESFAKTILNFADRSEEDKSPKHWGLRIVQTPEGPVIESCL